MKRLDEHGHPTPEALDDERKLQALYAMYRGVDPDYVHAGSEALERWQDWKFGLRIHWGLYAITGVWGESWSLVDAVKRGIKGAPPNTGAPEHREQYETLYKWWNPARFNADEWADLMVRAGFKYFSFTTKHHDGFALFDTKARVKRRLVHTGPDAGKIVPCDLAYSIMESPFKRDIVREIVDAGRKHDLGIGLYFSHADWFDSDMRFDPWGYQADMDPGYRRDKDPDGYRRAMARHRQQILELCTNYGKIDLLSFDMGFGNEEEWARYHQSLGIIHGVRDDVVTTVKQARRLQPEMLMRERGIVPYGDYHTPEGVIPEQAGTKESGADMPWKVIYPGGQNMSFRWLDEYKPASWVIESLVDITAKGGNFQVGYGPMPDGTWADAIARRLEEVGQWLKIHGEGIYGTRGYRVFKEGPHVRFTRTKDHRHVYAFLLNWFQPPFAGGALRLEAVRAKPGSAIRMLGLDHDFKYRQDERALVVEIPEWLANPDNRPSPYPVALKIEAAAG